MKKVFPFILTLFFIILLAVPVSWLTSRGSSPEESVVEARELVALKPATNPNLRRALDFIEEGKYREAAGILIDLYTSASFVKQFERSTSDQFPLRMPIIQFSKATERVIIKLAYSILPDTTIPADMSTDIYYDKAHNQLLFSPTLFNETTRESIDGRIRNYEELIEAYPEKNFYLYYLQTLHNSRHHTMNSYFEEADEGQSINYFEQNLPEGLRLEKFMLNSMEDHLEYYYRTDHHWNVYGMLLAYEQIYDMLSKDYSDISPMLEYEKIVKFPEIEFLGRMARVTFYPIEGDDFEVEVIDIPPFDMIKSGQVIEEHPRLAYFAGEYSKIPYTNHFNEFYGKVTDLIEYTFDNDSDRNLLIIGSSFRNALDPLLGSHYHKTFCIDLRYYTDFSLSDFLKEHEVDDILIVGENDVAFEDLEYWKINP